MTDSIISSVFHIQAETPEEMRQAVVEWLESEALNRRVAARHERTQRGIAIELSAYHALQSAADFWRRINIDRKKESVGNAASASL